MAEWFFHYFLLDFGRDELSLLFKQLDRDQWIMGDCMNHDYTISNTHLTKIHPDWLILYARHKLGYTDWLSIAKGLPRHIYWIRST